MYVCMYEKKVRNIMFLQVENPDRHRNEWMWGGGRGGSLTIEICLEMYVTVLTDQISKLPEKES